MSTGTLVKNWKNLGFYSGMFAVGALIGVTIYGAAYALYNTVLYFTGFSRQLITISTTVGWAFWPLLAIGMYLTWLSFLNIKSLIKGTQLSNTNILHLEVIAWLSMMTGLAATVTALIKAMQAVDISLGIQETITNLNHSLGEALWTTAIGIIMSIIAQLQVSLQPEESEENE